MGFEIAIVTVLLLIGIVLILVEIFFLPGITFAAIGGALFTAGGLWFAYTRMGATAGNIALVSGVVAFGVSFLYLVKSKALNKIALDTNVESTVADEDVLKIQPGDRGMTISRLNPIGKARVNDIVVEAKTLGDFVDEGVAITVLKVFPTQVVVKETPTES